MNITKLPSGSYRIRAMENGKAYSVTVPYKPSKKEAYEIIRAKMDGTRDGIPFKDAYTEYIKAKSNVLSPSTIRGYESMHRNTPSWILNTDITQIDNYIMQKAVNEYAATHSPKSTSNFYSYLLTVIRLFYPNAVIYATLPQKPRREPYTPSHEDVIRLLEYAEPSDFYVPLYLASMSLRVSEICALTLEDLNGNNLTVNKALVRSDKGYVLKPTPKTDASNRIVTLPGNVADRIRSQGYIYDKYPQQIDKYLRRTLPKLGIPFFSPHKLRHFYASYCHELNISDAMIKKSGGWSSDVFRRVYTHAMNEDETRKHIADAFTF